MAQITEKRRKEEAAKLKAMKPKLPEFSHFGDNNHSAISAQIKVLEKDLSEDEIDERFEDINAHIHSNAMDARMWVDGDEGTSPSESWAPLVK